MLYFLTSHNNPEFQQKDGQESNQTFSKINLIATTPKGFALLVLGGLAISLLTFMLGFISGKWVASSATKSNLENASISNMPHQFPPAPPGTPIPSGKPPDTATQAPYTPVAESAIGAIGAPKPTVPSPQPDTDKNPVGTGDPPPDAKAIISNSISHDLCRKFPIGELQVPPPDARPDITCSDPSSAHPTAQQSETPTLESSEHESSSR